MFKCVRVRERACVTCEEVNILVDIHLIRWGKNTKQNLNSIQPRHRPYIVENARLMDVNWNHHQSFGKDFARYRHQPKPQSRGNFIYSEGAGAATFDGTSSCVVYISRLQQLRIDSEWLHLWLGQMVCLNKSMGVLEKFDIWVCVSVFKCADRKQTQCEKYVWSVRNRRTRDVNGCADTQWSADR